MRTTLFVVAAVSFSLATPQAVSACVCAGPPPSPLAALAGADAVFTGTVIEIVEPAIEVEVDGDKFEFSLFSITKFKVDRVWKGVDEEETTIITIGDDGACGYTFKLSEGYLVYGRVTGIRPSLVDVFSKDIDEVEEFPHI